MITLRKGRRGPDVERWQRFLSSQLLLDGPTDGIFEERTDAASRAFQEREGLKADGVIGPITFGRAQALGFQAVRRVGSHELTPDLIEHAKRIIRDHFRDPFGSELPFENAGKHYFGRIEQHYHPPGGPVKPWGYHAGVSLFVAVTLGPAEPVHDDATPEP